MMVFAARLPDKAGRTMTLFSWWLTVLSTILLIIQSQSGRMRPNPFCPEQLVCAHPSLPIFYGVAIMTYALGYSWWHWSSLSVPHWMLILGLGQMPIWLHLRFGFNGVGEVIFNAAVGVATTVLFLVLALGLAAPHYHRLWRAVPLVWF